MTDSPHAPLTSTDYAEMAADYAVNPPRADELIDIKAGPGLPTFAPSEEYTLSCDVNGCDEIETEAIDFDAFGADGDALYAKLYPTCEHGLSASLCAGPQHYPYDDEERAHYGY